MELVHECTFQARLEGAVTPGAGPFGTRAIMTVSGGWMKGPRLNGTLVGATGDWALVGPDGFARLDVRAQVQTDDGAVIYLTYPGLLEMNEATRAALAGGETQFDDHYYRTTPRMETGDARYAWVNQTIFVARGRLVPGAVEYEVYRVT